MEFTLTYRGPLRSNRRPAEKHALRKQFHRQLVTLWDQQPLVGLKKLLDPNPGPGEFTILELAEKIIELTGSKSDIVFAELPADDPVQRQPDIALAKEVIGWEPRIALDEGLKKTVDYFEAALGG